MANKRTHITITTPVLEMAEASDLAGLVKVDAEYIRQITDGDDEPKYLIVELDEQRSSAGVNYDYDAFSLIAKQVNEKQPVGYSGHKHFQGKDKEDLLPDPQALWLGATVVKQSNGKAKLIAKGYLLPDSLAKIRGWLKTNVVNSVSWAGDAALTPGRNGGWDMKEYVLESIDFARKNREGLKGQRLTVVTEEEFDDKKDRRTKVEDDRSYEDIVGRLVFADLKAHNPALLRTITEMAKDEVKDETAVAVQAKEDELTAKHDKELTEVPEITLMQKIRNLLGLKDDADPVAALSEFLERLDTVSRDAVRSWFEADILSKKVPNEKARRLISRLIPVTEMEGDWRSDNGVEKIKGDLEARVDDALENDDVIKETVKEMSSDRGGLRLPSNTRGSSENRNDDKKDSTYEDGVKRGNFEVEEVSV